ncbi:MAG: TonB-dependent receptor, partial [Gammaproteobacteria bacterium]|nr:TonB-dependent receptor [Gammaproteobacteria bacterium]
GSLGDAVQARLSVATNQYDGYVKNRIGPDGNEADSLAYRLQVRFDVTDSTDILVNVHGGTSDAIAPYYQHETTDFDGDGAPDPVDLYGYADTDGDVWAGDYDQVGVLDIENTGGSVTINWSGDTMDFTSITGVEGVDKLHREDTDMGPNAAVLPTFAADVDSFSQEFRLSGRDDRMNWVAGAYFFDSDAENTLDLSVNYPDGFVEFLDALPEAFGGFEGGLAALAGYAPGADPGALIPFLTYDVDYEQDTESQGVFGQVEYSLSDAFAVTFGLRYTTEERSFSYVNNFGDRDGDGDISNADGVFTNFFQELNTLDLFPPEWFAFSGDIDNDNVSGKLGIEYRPIEDVMIFGNYSRGFKSGGFNGGFLDETDGVVPEDTPYQEEILNSFELGIKSTLAEGRLRLNATAFVYDYEDYQALTFSGLSQFIANSDADLSGLDFELVWQPGENWDFLIGASFLDTEVKEVVVQGVPVAGTEMVLAPESSLNGLVRYSIPLTADSWVALQLDFNHQGDHYFDITNSDLSKEDAYTVVNARVSYQVNDKLNLAAWVKNLTDEEYRVYTFDFTSIAGFNQQFFAPPQWFGVTAHYQF